MNRCVEKCRNETTSKLLICNYDCNDVTYVVQTTDHRAQHREQTRSIKHTANILLLERNAASHHFVK